MSEDEKNNLIKEEEEKINKMFETKDTFVKICSEWEQDIKDINSLRLNTFDDDIFHDDSS